MYSARVVHVALLTNFLCFVTKICAFFYTGSSSLFSESLHSVVDMVNQYLLAVGIRRSRREPSERHPLGFGNEQFVWGLFSAISILLFGVGVGFYHAIEGLCHGRELQNLLVAFFVLLFSGILEGISLKNAINAVIRGMRQYKMTILQYCLNGPDSMGVAVFVEDCAALLGVFIAALGSGLSYLTGYYLYDAVGLMLVSLLLALTALFLVRRNMNALLGQAIPEFKYQLIMQALSADPVVKRIHSAKGVMIGADVASFSTKVDFDHSYLVKNYLEMYPNETLLNKINSSKDVAGLLEEFAHHILNDLGVHIDRLEVKLKQVVPEIKFLDLEVNNTPMITKTTQKDV